MEIGSQICSQLNSLVLSALRRTDESLMHIQSALRSDPLSLPINNLWE